VKARQIDRATLARLSREIDTSDEGGSK
jgi:hypothetical protein